ncbi:MAG: hypothetical protein HKN16_06110 [Saprospiraceae bacterium]|nr:hypothetical protein [Saprospiraceae bacterium]
MQLEILKSLIRRFESQLNSLDLEDLQILLDIQNQWRKHWDLESADFLLMYEKSLDSKISRKFWKSQDGDAKKMLQDLGRMDPEFSRRTFRSLFDKQKELSKRISSFQFGLEVQMEEFKTRNRTSILTRHLHEDTFLPMLYISLENPEEVAPYFHHSFMEFMKEVRAKPEYEHVDVERYKKVLRTINHFLSKSESIQEKFQGVFPPWIAMVFYRWVGLTKKLG